MSDLEKAFAMWGIIAIIWGVALCIAFILVEHVDGWISAWRDHWQK